MKVTKDTLVKMANAKKAWLLDYQEEREKKREIRTRKSLILRTNEREKMS